MMRECIFSCFTKETFSEHVGYPLVLGLIKKLQCVCMRVCVLLTFHSRACSTAGGPCSNRSRWARSNTRRTWRRSRARSARSRAAGSGRRWETRSPHTPLPLLCTPDLEGAYQCVDRETEEGPRPGYLKYWVQISPMQPHPRRKCWLHPKIPHGHNVKHWKIWLFHGYFVYNTTQMCVYLTWFGTEQLLSPPTTIIRVTHTVLGVIGKSFWKPHCVIQFSLVSRF